VNHPFTPSISNMLMCAVCKKDGLAHTDHAVCDCCPNIGPVELRYGTMLMCSSCWLKEQQLQLANNTPAKQAERVDSLNAAIEASRAQDASIQVRTDIFNAATVAIAELKAAIDHDPAITNKPFHLASELTTRFNHFTSVIHSKNQEIIDAANQQKAIQVYLNNMANTLRQEEREKLKLSDINYKPAGPKIARTPKAVKVNSTKKLDKAEVRKFAAELGIPEYTIQMLCVSKNMTPEQAAGLLRRSINEAKSQVTN
jgi:hypothetical protein